MTQLLPDTYLMHVKKNAMAFQSNIAWSCTVIHLSETWIFFSFKWYCTPMSFCLNNIWICFCFQTFNRQYISQIKDHTVPKFKNSNAHKVYWFSIIEFDFNIFTSLLKKLCLIVFWFKIYYLTQTVHLLVCMLVLVDPS